MSLDSRVFFEDELDEYESHQPNGGVHVPRRQLNPLQCSLEEQIDVYVDHFGRPARIPEPPVLYEQDLGPSDYLVLHSDVPLAEMLEYAGESIGRPIDLTFLSSVDLTTVKKIKSSIWDYRPRWEIVNLTANVGEPPLVVSLTQRLAATELLFVLMYSPEYAELIGTQQYPQPVLGDYRAPIVVRGGKIDENNSLALRRNKLDGQLIMELALGDVGLSNRCVPTVRSP